MLDHAVHGQISTTASTGGALPSPRSADVPSIANVGHISQKLIFFVRKKTLDFVLVGLVSSITSCHAYMKKGVS
jgi:hypothetical protein